MILETFQLEFFDRECHMYEVILPMIAKAREDHQLKPVKVPECFYTEDNPGIMIMENLKDQGFGGIESKENGKCPIC